MEYKSGEGLLVSKKSEALLNRIYPALVNFPKSEKFALCQEIKNHFYGLISNIEMANSGMLVSEVGLPLGNTLSQLCANIYLNALDQYCMRYLGYKFYVRYADDIVIVLPDKEAAKVAKDQCVSFLRGKLNLRENPKKTQIFPISQGVNCFGFKIYRTHRLLRDDSKKKIKRKIKKMPRLIANGLMTVETANQMLGSWSGHAKYGSTQNFIKSILERRAYIKWDGKKIAINEEELKCYITKTRNTS